MPQVQTGARLRAGDTLGLVQEGAIRHRIMVPFDEPGDLPGWKLHPLSGDLAGHWAVWVRGNWRLTFTFDGEDAVLVDYQNYH